MEVADTEDAKLISMVKLFPYGYIKYPITDLHISCQLVPAFKSVFNHINILHQED